MADLHYKQMTYTDRQNTGTLAKKKTGEMRTTSVGGKKF